MLNPIEVLCDGDFCSRDLARQEFELPDMELLLEKMKKAAATSSDQSQ
ncbi:hypothetical protein M7775_18150 [Sporomusa sphaeroides DSM 2875]|nr:hypothetical protein [Sporomusa sphaeroides]MCM0760479.1 hypothetical protein [Sporomusa sphaeroides DSM 2875]